MGDCMDDSEFIARAQSAAYPVTGHVFWERLSVPEDPRAVACVVAFDRRGRVRLIPWGAGLVVRAHRADDTALDGILIVSPGLGCNIRERAFEHHDPVAAAVGHVIGHPLDGRDYAPPDAT